LQHIELDPPKMSIVTDMIYGEAVGYQKKNWFEKGGQFSSSLSLVFHFEHIFNLFRALQKSKNVKTKFTTLFFF
jgi:hypothetical protein